MAQPFVLAPAVPEAILVGHVITGRVEHELSNIATIADIDINADDINLVRKV